MSSDYPSLQCEAWFLRALGSEKEASLKLGVTMNVGRKLKRHEDTSHLPRVGPITQH